MRRLSESGLSHLDNRLQRTSFISSSSRSSSSSSSSSSRHFISCPNPYRDRNRNRKKTLTQLPLTVSIIARQLFHDIVLVCLFFLFPFLPIQCWTLLLLFLLLLLPSFFSPFSSHPGSVWVKGGEIGHPLEVDLRRRCRRFARSIESNLSVLLPVTAALLQAD